MSKVKIYVACHKPCELPQNPLYEPIHVGRAISKYKEEMKDMIGDDTGDNISEKNPYYSEMTAQYWAWKNDHDSNFIGFCHYRRHYGNEVDMQKYLTQLKNGKADVLMIEPFKRYMLRITYASLYISPEDIAIMIKVVEKLYPSYTKELTEYAYGYKDYCLNMFICRKELFCQYAEWIFNILSECEKHVKLSGYSRARRIYGYYSEFLMPVFFMHNKYKIDTIPYYNSEVKMWQKKSILGKLKDSIIVFILRNIINRRYKFYKTVIIEPSIENGLKNDGIIMEYSTPTSQQDDHYYYKGYSTN